MSAPPDEYLHLQVRIPLDRDVAAALLFLAASGAAVFYVAFDWQANDAQSSASLLLAMGLAACTGVGIALAAHKEHSAHPHLVWMGAIALSSFSVTLVASAHKVLAAHGYLRVTNRATFENIATWAGLVFVLACLVLVISALYLALARRHWLWLGAILVATASALFAINSHAFDRDVSLFLYVMYFSVVELPAIFCTAYAIFMSVTDRS
jgi:lysylphosphatidylglycerol synthetase-like protein (DUF2156 family)